MAPNMCESLHIERHATLTKYQLPSLLRRQPALQKLSFFIQETTKGHVATLFHVVNQPMGYVPYRSANCGRQHCSTGSCYGLKTLLVCQFLESIAGNGPRHSGNA